MTRVALPEAKLKVSWRKSAAVNGEPMIGIEASRARQQAVLMPTAPCEGVPLTSMAPVLSRL